MKLKNLTLLAAAALLAANIYTAPANAALNLPASTVCFTSSGVYEGNGYLDLTLTGVPAGYDVANGTYTGWCVEAFNFDFTVGNQYCGATLRASTSGSLPAHLASIPWGIVNYILNNKQGNPDDVQNAIWHFTDGWVVTPGENTGAYQAIIAAATGQSSFVPGPGQVEAVVLDLGVGPGPQIVIIEVPTSQEGPGTGTPGYWKNHPDAWPVATITLGGVVYSKFQAITIMNQPTSKDKTYNLAEHLIAAKLNVLIGNDSSCIAAAITAADAFLAAHPIGSNVKASSADWQSISGVFAELVAYNEGLLCAPPRD